MTLDTSDDLYYIDDDDYRVNYIRNYPGLFDDTNLYGKVASAYLRQDISKAFNDSGTIKTIQEDDVILKDCQSNSSLLADNKDRIKIICVGCQNDS